MNKKLNIKTMVRLRSLEGSSANFIVQNEEKFKIRYENKTAFVKFDKIFDINASQMEVFDNLLPNIERFANNEASSIILMYGETNSGKSYTLNGI